VAEKFTTTKIVDLPNWRNEWMVMTMVPLAVRPANAEVFNNDLGSRGGSASNHVISFNEAALYLQTTDWLSRRMEASCADAIRSYNHELCA
jgi:hypothetical protein